MKRRKEYQRGLEGKELKAVSILYAILNGGQEQIEQYHDAISKSIEEDDWQHLLTAVECTLQSICESDEMYYFFMDEAKEWQSRFEKPKTVDWLIVWDKECMTVLNLKLEGKDNGKN